MITVYQNFSTRTIYSFTVIVRFFQVLNNLKIRAYNYLAHQFIRREFCPRLFRVVSVGCLCYGVSFLNAAPQRFTLSSGEQLIGEELPDSDEQMLFIRS